MITPSISPPPVALRPWRLATGLLLAWLGGTLLASCGGGVGTGGTGSFGSGPVSGFGSIFVGGIEFDDSQATVVDDDGVALPAAHASLRLGAMSEVEGGAVVDGPAGPTAVAETVRLTRLVVGPVTAVDVSRRTLNVLGQTLHVNGSTVFDESMRAGLAGLHVGDVVSAHALADAAGQPVATRIEPAAMGEAWRIRGFVAGFNPSARRFSIGAATLDVSNAANVPAGLAEGQYVHVKLMNAANFVSGSALTVSRFVPASATPLDAVRVAIEGVVVAPSSQGNFRIGAIAVDGSGATVLPASAALVAGAQAQVEGRLQANTLVASKVTLLTPQQADQRSYRLAGMVTALNVAGQTFVLRNVGIDYSAARFVNGTAGALAFPSISVHVQGRLSADGTRVQANLIVLP